MVFERSIRDRNPLHHTDIFASTLTALKHRRHLTPTIAPKTNTYTEITMSEGLVSKKIYSKAVKTALYPRQIQQQLERMSREEPILYTGAHKERTEIIRLLREAKVSEEIIRGVDHNLGAMIARVYIALKTGTFELWLSVESMRDALGKNWKGGPGDAKGGDPYPLDDSWL